MGLTKQIQFLPQTPGVYFFKNKAGQILYIGKATKLKSRVSSYFRASANLGPWKEQLVQEIYKIDFEETGTAIGALLREAELIKKYHPKYNVVLKDDKSYVYIGITKGPIVKIFVSHQREQEAEYFGPFTDAAAAREVVRLAQRIFVLHKLHAADIQEYREAVREVQLFLRGDTKKLFKSVELAMKQAAKSHDFERAALLRDRLWRLQKIWQTEEQRDLLKSEPEVRVEGALEELHLVIPSQSEGSPANAGNQRADKPRDPSPAFERVQDDSERAGGRQGGVYRIEGYDMSNIQGKFAVGSMVVFINGKPDKSEYRKFKIRTVRGANDVAMMYEVLRRRFRHLKDWGVPDLILLDGGRGQMTFGLKAQQDAGVTLPMIGLAKREEQIVLANGKLLKLSRDSAALQLLQAVRDEAHRFARGYYRVLHNKTMR